MSTSEAVFCASPQTWNPFAAGGHPTAPPQHHHHSSLAQASLPPSQTLPGAYHVYNGGAIDPLDPANGTGASGGAGSGGGGNDDLTVVSGPFTSLLHIAASASGLTPSSSEEFAAHFGANTVAAPVSGYGPSSAAGPPNGAYSAGYSHANMHAMMFGDSVGAVSARHPHPPSLSGPPGLCFGSGSSTGGSTSGQGLGKGGAGQSVSGKPKRKRVATVAQRRAANIRERRRMFSLNEAFDSLRARVPTFAYEKRLSRIETLRLAITYISFMGEVLSGANPDEVKLTVPKGLAWQVAQEEMAAVVMASQQQQQQ